MSAITGLTKTRLYNLWWQRHNTKKSKSPQDNYFDKRKGPFVIEGANPEKRKEAVEKYYPQGILPPADQEKSIVEHDIVEHDWREHDIAEHGADGALTPAAKKELLQKALAFMGRNAAAPEEASQHRSHLPLQEEEAEEAKPVTAREKRQQKREAKATREAAQAAGAASYRQRFNEAHEHDEDAEFSPTKAQFEEAYGKKTMPQLKAIAAANNPPLKYSHLWTKEMVLDYLGHVNFDLKEFEVDRSLFPP